MDQRRASAALSSRVVQVDARMRPCDVRESIDQSRPTHAVVVEGGKCLGVLSLPEALRNAPERPFGDLLPCNPPEAISAERLLDDIARQLAEADVDAVPVVDERGTPLGVVTRQSVLAALLEENRTLARSESLLHSVLESAPAIISRIDRDGCHVYVNRAAPGMSVEDIVGRHITAVIPPEFRSAFQSHLDQVARDREPVRFEFRGVGPEGTTVLYIGRMAPLEQNGEFAGWTTVVTDATDSRKVEQALRQSEQRLQEVLNNAPVVLFALDRHGAFTMAEGRGRRLGAAPPGDLIGRSAADQFHDSPQMLAVLARAMAGEEFNSIVEYAGRAYNCHVAPLRDANGDFAGVIGVATDITDRRNAETALSESERRLQQVVNNAPVVLFAVDRNGVFTLSEGKALQTLGLKPGEVVGRSALEMYRDSPDVQQGLERALQGDEHAVVTRAGERDFECRYSPIINSDGSVAGVIGVATDITDRRRAEMALCESELRLQQVINRTPILLFATDRNGVYTLSEGKAVLAFGARPGDAVGKSAFERYRDHPTITESIRRALTGEEFTAVAEIGGRTYECLCSPTQGADGAVTGMIGVATDVTARRRAERQSRRLLDQLAHTGRISTMGEMASGLAHELNQPLAAIVAYVDACQELVESGRMDAQQLSEVLRSVSSQAERAGQIIHRLRRMIKRSQPVRAVVSVNDAVREVTELFESEARQAGVTIELVLAPDLPSVAADFLQVQQLLLNLMRNGREAMTDVLPDQRRLTIRTGRTAEGDIEVAVVDSGHGLNGASAEQLFEPFFTTKTNGLGLGLSISRTIIDAHGGKIWITANDPCGVTARFTLPQSSG